MSSFPDPHVFPQWVADFTTRLAERSMPQYRFVLVDDTYILRFVDPRLEEKFAPGESLAGRDYFAAFFSLDMSRAEGKKRATRIPLFNAFEKFRNTGQFRPKRPYPIVITPTNRAYLIETDVKPVPMSNRYMGIEFWDTKGDAGVWKRARAQGDPNIIVV